MAGAAMETIVSVLVLSVLFTIPTALVFVPGLLIWNAESRRGFIAPMWELMGEGERRTAVFARALGLEDRPPGEQEREVKRVKDRIKKRMQRAGGRDE